MHFVNLLINSSVPQTNVNITNDVPLKGWRGTPPSGLLFQLSSMFAMFSDAFPSIVFYKHVALVIDVSCDVDRAAAETDGDISISWGWRGN